jgi:hypothetical protein
MDQNEFLTPEQRKGLIYGSLISAILSGGAALRSGGNFTDAMGRATLGSAEAFGGGLDAIAKIKHQEIENAKNEEAIRASQEAQGLAKKRQTMEEAAHKITGEHVTAQTAALKSAEASKTDRAQRLISFLAAQEPVTPTSTGGVPPAGELSPSVLTPEQSQILRAIGPEKAGDVLGTIMKPSAYENYLNTLTGEIVKGSKIAPPPPNTVTMPQAIQQGKTLSAEALAQQERERKEAETNARIASQEKIAKEKADAAAKAAKEKADAAAKAAKEKEAQKEESKKTKVYWDSVKGAPAEIAIGKKNPETQWDPATSRVAKRMLEKYQREHQGGTAGQLQGGKTIVFDKSGKQIQ